MVEMSEMPGIRKDGFVCPHCGAFAEQQWSQAYSKFATEGQNPVAHGGTFWLSKCRRCRGVALWIDAKTDAKMVYPRVVLAPSPNADLPDDVAADYREAAQILADSPRGAAALLRLAIQKLCAFLGEDARDLNEAIAKLVARGLLPLVQRALDIVRVIGNEAVHPGTIDMRDDRDSAVELFGLVNVIAEQMISQPRRVEELYAQLPEGKRDAIEKRDQRAGAKEPGA